MTAAIVQISKVIEAERQSQEIFKHLKGRKMNDELPKSKRHLITFIIAVFTICVATYALDVWITRSTEESSPTGLKLHLLIIKSIAENLIAGAIAALILALTYRYIVWIMRPGDRVIEVPPREITSRLIKNAQKTRSYVFIGNTATFVASSILPILRESARTSGRPISISLFLINPTNNRVLKEYVTHKYKAAQGALKTADNETTRWVSPSADPKQETHESAAAKVLAAVYLGAYASIQPGVTVCIYLRNMFTPFRADITDGEAVLTQESPNDSAVAFSADGHFYGWYHKEAEAQKQQMHELDLANLSTALRNANLAHPSESTSQVQASLITLLAMIPILAPLRKNSGLMAATVRRICRPRHDYMGNH